MNFRHFFLALCAGAFLAAGPANAQISLPGAVPAGPIGEAAPAKKKPARPKKAEPGPTKAPLETAATDRSLLHNGAKGRLELEMRDKALHVVKLSLAGDAPGRPGEACKVDAVMTPVPATPAGRPHGLARYEVALASCKFTFEILDGAVLVEAERRPCEFSTPACRVDLNGLWGPLASSLPTRAKDIESARTRAESAMRANFKTLLAKTDGREATKLVAREQAGFTSQREMICRDYEGETKHGFCAARITEARAVTLGARLAEPAPASPDKPAKKRRARAKPKPAQSAGAPAPPPM